jgi:hypothetical protein
MAEVLKQKDMQHMSASSLNALAIKTQPLALCETSSSPDISVLYPVSKKKALTAVRS